MAANGYVVSRPYTDSNVGSNLASLAGALWLARRLSRTVVVDWRGLSQLPDPALNYFTEFFEARPLLSDVEIAYAPASEVGDYDPGGDAAWISPEQARALGAGEVTETVRHIVLQPYHGLDRLHPGPEPERLRRLRSFYHDLDPDPEIRARADLWWEEETHGSAVVGVNVRTGNGRYFGKGETYASRVDVSVFENRQRFLRVIERACRQRLKSLPKSRRENAVVFYATDAEWMSELLAGLPNAVTRRSLYPPAGTGDTHAFDDDLAAARTSIVDTLVDMFLLARCDALIYNSSLFNQYARIVTDDFGGNQVHIETLFLRTRSRHLAAAARRRLPRAGA